MNRRIREMLIGLVVFATLVGCSSTSANAPLLVTATAQPISTVTSQVPMNKPTGKLSSRLEMLAQSPALRAMSIQDQARALSLAAQGAGSLMRDAQGRILVTIRVTDAGDQNVQALRDAGAVIVNVSAQYLTITAFVAPDNLESIANLSFIQSVQEQLTPGTGGGVMPPPRPYP